MTDQINKLIESCNAAVKQIASGNYIAWCGIMCSMVQQLIALRDGISNGGTENGKN